MKKLLLAVVALAVVAGGCYIITPDGEIIGVVGPVFAPPTVVVAAPAMSYIAGTQIRTMTGALGEVFYLNGVYWRYYNGRWWRSSQWNAGWGVVSTVPRAFLQIPATHRAHGVVKSHPLYKKSTPKVKVPATGRPAVKRPAVKRPATKKPAGKKPAVKKPAAKRPAVKRPSGKKPSVKKPSGKKPSGKKPSGKPASKEKKKKKGK